MDKWSTVTVENCLDRLSLGNLPTLQTSEYKSSGKYPIIDQGQSLIAAWTDDRTGLITNNLPVIVFGDHTRAFKYVDFPFVRGADGTQILKPRHEIHPLFFYYACRALDLPSRGYNRHFKALKEKEIQLPSFDSQIKIAAALKLIDDARLVQSERLAVLDGISDALLHKLMTSETSLSDLDLSALEESVSTKTAA